MMAMPEIRARLAALGYTLLRDQRDVYGRRWKFRTSPSHRTDGTIGGGPTNYLADTAALARYIRQVEQVRAWQAELLPLAESA